MKKQLLLISLMIATIFSAHALPPLLSTHAITPFKNLLIGSTIAAGLTLINEFDRIKQEEELQTTPHTTYEKTLLRSLIHHELTQDYHQLTTRYFEAGVTTLIPTYLAFKKTMGSLHNQPVTEMAHSFLNATLLKYKGLNGSAVLLCTAALLTVPTIFHTQESIQILLKNNEQDSKSQSEFDTTARKKLY
jgi:hypothetical protein